MNSHPSPANPPSSLFTPKLVTVWRESYTLAQLRADAVAGLTVAVVALPLSMAIAIASGASPDRGLVTAIIGGFIISAFGGSRFQIGGPAGAFIVLVAATITRHGYDGFLLATIMAGVILMLVGALRLGTYIKFIPHPVTVGFTSGIAIIIFASQIRDLLGLTLPGAEPAALIPKLEALGESIGTINPAAAALSLGAIALIIGLRRLRPGWPGFLIAVVLASAATSLLGLPVETIGTRFGAIPDGLPAPRLPDITLDTVVAVMPDAFAMALLGGIESLLSAVVADTMTGRRHRSNCELVAQGAANVVTALFGGLIATGTIARTATNIRAGATSPVSGMLHSVFLFLFLLFAASLITYVPLAALAAVLAVVCWNMAERHVFVQILRQSRGEALVLLATFLVTILHDLAMGIAVGVVMGSFLFMHRMADLVSVSTGGAGLAAGSADVPDSEVEAPLYGASGDGDIQVYQISGPLFFGAASTIGSVLERMGVFPKAVVLDLSPVPLADSTAALSLKLAVDTLRSNGAVVVIGGAKPEVRHILKQEGLKPPVVSYAPDVESARAIAVRTIGTRTSAN
ncbi:MULTISPECIES: SulP family inorganic anion transporter [unclassified Chelatococcus]|uniref:SulP family inorganic anion transporter n=1 Tax=unclassified Chelatococcus TaxID=2638111 RepID=UPI001BCC1A36|nr:MULTISPECIES: SulP family inorganic anion transporter [unclassified Chelatococcus]MBS7695658.1 SulP family inorganic anion transporter [Chelatococcus sp. YT9]MBX3557949.1 SulP family inorganic anion transporter [Chelatococcus sp.]